MARHLAFGRFLGHAAHYWQLAKSKSHGFYIAKGKKLKAF